MHGICAMKLYLKLDHWIMQFESFHWLSHHGLWAIIPCSKNKVSVRASFLLLLLLFLIFGFFILILVYFSIFWGRF